MKKRIVLLLSMGLLLAASGVYFTQWHYQSSDESPGDNEQVTDSMVIDPIIDQQVDTESAQGAAKSISKNAGTYVNNDYLYDDSLIAQDIYSELVKLAEAGDGRAAQRVVSVDTRCSMARLPEVHLDSMLDEIGQVLISSDDGRVFFNQSLLFVGANLTTYDELASYVQSSEVFCDDFDGIINKGNWFHYLKLAADFGLNDARIALWGMGTPSYSKAIGNNSRNPADLEYLRLVEEENLWKETKLRYLYEAAGTGDSRAFVLLGDILSSSNWTNPDLVKAYTYYYMADAYYDYPFIPNRLTSLENEMLENEITLAIRNASRRLAQLETGG